MQRADIMRGPRASVTPARLALLLAGPAAVAVAAWVYLSVMMGDMSTMPGMSAIMMRVFSPMQVIGLFVMWAVMMAAMMLPTAVPMIAAYARMQGADRAKGVGWLPVFAFSGGYVVAWAAFSLVAAGLQAWLTNLAMMSPMMMQAAGPLGGAILVGAGLYQFSPLKQACLHQCRTPISFLMTQWREHSWGAFRMGLTHGLFCIGCCWALMGLLFVVGVMNAAWIIAITIFVLIEKAVPAGDVISKVAGAGMIGAGVWIMV